MFRTIGNTIRLMETSSRVLFSDRELMLFPLCLGGCLLLVALYVLVAFVYGGTFERLANDVSVHTADVVFLAIAYFAASFVIVYFSTGLVAVAHYRLLDGGGDFRMGLEAANDRLGAIAMWALIAATVGLVIRYLADRGGVVGRTASALAEMLWGWATFLVLPVMVVENATPLDAMRRSTELFRDTWGKTLVANFGFGVVYVLAFVAAMVPVALLLMAGASFALALFTAVTLYTMAASTVKCMETVFTVALYNYATNGDPDGTFPEPYLRDAFVYKSQKGRFGPPSLPGRAAA